MAVPVVRHCSGHICSKQTELKVATQATNDVQDSKTNKKSTDSQSQPVGRTRQQTNAIKSSQAMTSTGIIIHPSGRPCRKQNNVNQAAIKSNTETSVNKATEVAKGLLLLNMDENADDLEQELNKNAELMPVGAPQKPDLVKEIEQEKMETQGDDNDTEEYSTDTETKQDADSDKSPIGKLVTRKYDLKRKNIKQ